MWKYAQDRTTYINNTITKGFMAHNSRSFRRYIESRYQEHIEVTSMTKNGSLVYDSKETANIHMDQFQSVFNIYDGSAPQHTDSPQHPIISDVNINTAGICTLLKSINPNKAQRNPQFQFKKQTVRPPPPSPSPSTPRHIPTSIGHTSLTHRLAYRT